MCKKGSIRIVPAHDILGDNMQLDTNKHTITVPVRSAVLFPSGKLQLGSERDPLDGKKSSNEFKVWQSASFSTFWILSDHEIDNDRP